MIAVPVLEKPATEASFWASLVSALAFDEVGGAEHIPFQIVELPVFQ